MLLFGSDLAQAEGKRELETGRESLGYQTLAKLCGTDVNLFRLFLFRSFQSQFYDFFVYLFIFLTNWYNLENETMYLTNVRHIIEFLF